MRSIVLVLALLALVLPLSARAQTADLAGVIAQYRDQIEKPSRQTVEPVVAAIAATGPQGAALLQAWGDRLLGLRKSDGRLVIAAPEGDALHLTDAATGADLGPAPEDQVTLLRPNSGVRGLISAAMAGSALSDPDPKRRAEALEALSRKGDAAQLGLLRQAMDDPDPTLAARKQRLERLLTIQYDTDPAARIAAMQSFGGDTSLEFRASLNPILTTRRVALETIPADANVADELAVGSDIPRDAAYAMLVDAGLAPARLTPQAERATLAQHIVNGMVGGVPVIELGDEAARDRAYTALEGQGLVQPAASEDEVTAALDRFHFLDVYAEPNADVTAAARAALRGTETRIGLMQAADLSLDALSLASIYFLAAIGLAITFGVMGVINMAHGEFIMMGAYTGYVVQQFISDKTISLIVALPLAFAVTFAAGVALERLVIRHLYKRPLETLLATFGVSIALQQLAKNIFGTQARPLTSPGWLDGALTFNDIVSISYIRIAIFVLALVFLGLYLFIMNRTRLGLEVRAVTQNPGMAASMGISPDRINMLTFGLGSGIAGIAGVAIGLFAKVTSELGSDYIVQSFMTVVVGGVGNIWGTLAGAALIGFLQKGIEWFNPANTLAAQTYMILFIIIFIQFRPRGIIAAKGRAAVGA
ncbi:urea ABC transporter permease subunit UrtB [Paracoccus limosus]|jgi:urea transport system permease protein|uniref:Urea ABC transporter permease subunit UrtB n=1 Tax=Paracoccus limosus TaxID=913252 RepID=A0A844H832_9RHOB|nr:urea ABC transporter permease subunit UrtB [Paracoccus limosus]MTH34687.1 urea ABC transporter permease subunit UrtB [Paracoccus limosus]